MTSPYVDDAVFLPGTGLVMRAPVGTAMPTSDELGAWLKTTRETNLNNVWVPFGYTSQEDLPGFDSATSGGDPKGAWENSSLRTTPIKVNDTLTVKPIQWTEEQLKHRFGASGTVDKAKGHFKVPDVYTASETAMLVVLLDGDRFLGFGYSKLSSGPDGGLSFSSEDFAALPIKYTVLGLTGRDKLTIIGKHLKAV